MSASARVVLFAFGPIGESIVAFCPPLVIADAEIDHIVEAVAKSVG